MIKNRKGVAGIVIVGIIALVLLAIYILLFLPVPSFTKLRSVVNYVLIILFWIIFQAGIILAYYHLGKLIVRGVRIYRNKFKNAITRIRSYLVFQGRR